MMYSKRIDNIDNYKSTLTKELVITMLKNMSTISDIVLLIQLSTNLVIEKSNRPSENYWSVSFNNITIGWKNVYFHRFCHTETMEMYITKNGKLISFLKGSDKSDEIDNYLIRFIRNEFFGFENYYNNHYDDYHREALLLFFDPEEEPEEEEKEEPHEVMKKKKFHFDFNNYTSSKNGVEVNINLHDIVDSYNESLTINIWD